MAFSRYADVAWLNHLFGKVTFTPPAHIYVGLSTTVPNTDGSNVTEPSGNGYARVTTSPSDWNQANSPGTPFITNANPVTFAASTGVWSVGANMVAVVVYDAANGGNFLGWGVLDTPQQVPNNKQPQFNAGSLYVQQGS